MALFPMPTLPRLPEPLDRIRPPTLGQFLNLRQSEPDPPPPPAPEVSPAHLMTLGLFVFGMDTAPYQSLRHAVEWRHGKSERHMARPASQFLGPGDETITLSGLLVPEIAGTYAAFDRLVEMADTGDDWPLMDGYGRVFGHFRIVKLDREHLTVMAGGAPRQIGFTLDLERVD